jgi:hypothetical protein
MPLHINISPLHRLVVIVARGQVAAGDIAAIKQQIADAKARPFAKIIDVSQGRSELTLEQVQRVADLLNGGSGEASRGPVAFVVDPDRVDFPAKFADVTQGERPIQLFRSLHEARAWVERARRAG